MGSLFYLCNTCVVCLRGHVPVVANGGGRAVKLLRRHRNIPPSPAAGGFTFQALFEGLQVPVEGGDRNLELGSHDAYRALDEEDAPVLDVADDVQPVLLGQLVHGDVELADLIPGDPADVLRGLLAHVAAGGLRGDLHIVGVDRGQGLQHMRRLLQLGDVDADAEQANDGLLPVADQVGGDAELVLVQAAPTVVGDEVGPVLVGPYGQLERLVRNPVAQGASGELAVADEDDGILRAGDVMHHNLGHGTEGIGYEFCQGKYLFKVVYCEMHG